MTKKRSLTFNDVYQVGAVLLPELATLCWARRQALLQRRLAAGQDERRWRLIVELTEKRIDVAQRRVTTLLDVLKFEAQEEMF